jgi:hypothetical protein
MTKEDEIMQFLQEKVFSPVINSPHASRSLKSGVNYTIMRMRQRDAKGMVSYYWSAVIGTDNSIPFARMMKAEGFTRFEEVLEEFRERFNDRWLES